MTLKPCKQTNMLVDEPSVLRTHLLECLKDLNPLPHKRVIGQSEFLDRLMTPKK